MRYEENFIDEVLTGEYTIEELKSELNSNYIIPEAQTITVENDKMTEVEFYNQLIETPKTDDGRNITLAIIDFISRKILPPFTMN